MIAPGQAHRVPVLDHQRLAGHKEGIGWERLRLIFYGLSAQAYSLFQRRPLFFWNSCERLLRSAVGIHLVHQGRIAAEVADHERRGLALHLRSRLARQEEGEVERDGQRGHADRFLPATRELEVQSGGLNFGMVVQKAPYSFTCLIVVQTCENHGHIDQRQLTCGRRAKLKGHGMAQQRGELPSHICSIRSGCRGRHCMP